MLVGQTAINFAANVFSAVFGLINVMIFTRLFAPAEFGIYVLGAGFGTIASHLHDHMAAAADHAGAGARRWHRHPRHHRAGAAISCLLAPVSYLGALLIGLDNGPALAAAGLSVAIGLFDTGQELLRARLLAFTVMKATIVRAMLVSVLGIAVSVLSHSGVLLLVSSALAYLLAAWVFFGYVWGGATVRFDGPRLLAWPRPGFR